MSEDKEDDNIEDAAGAILGPLLRQKKTRYVVWPKGYVLDRRLFKIFIIILLAITAIILIPDLLTGEYVKAYVRCPVDVMGHQCDNPLYGKCDQPACLKEKLDQGETIGEPPSSLPETFTYFTLITIAILFLFNHFSQKGPRYEDVRNNYYKQERKGRSSDKTKLKGA